MKRLFGSLLLLLLPFQISRLGLMILYGEQFAHLSFLQKITSWVEGLRFDLSSIAVFAFIPLLLFSLPLRPLQGKLWQTFWIGVITLEAALALAIGVGDLAYFPYVKRHLAFELNLLEGDWGLVAKMALRGFWHYLLILAVLLALIFWLGRQIFRMPLQPTLGWKGWFLFLFLCLFAGRGGLGNKPISVIDAYAKGDAAYGTLVLNAVFSISHAALQNEELSHEYYPEKRAYRLALGKKPGEWPLMKSFPGKEGVKPNLVFILVESLSSRYIGLFNPEQESLTPNLDRIFTQSHLFTEQFASGQRSLEGVQAVLTGLPSLIGLPTLGVGVTAKSPTMGGMLTQNGYQTLYAQAMERESFRGNSIAGYTGFQQYYGQEDIPLLLDYPDPDAAIFGWDYETLMFSLDKMKGMKSPFAAFIVTSTTHTPYPELPEGMARFAHNSDSEGGFKNSLIYTDWAIGEFMKAAAQEDWFKNTLFVITADHALPHYGKAKQAYLEYFRTPLAFYQPGKITPKQDPQLASQLDILPSLADQLGLRGEWGFLGQSLFQPRKKPFALVRLGSLMMLITDQGYVRHSLERRINGRGSKKAQKKIGDRLLAIDQVAYELLRENRWQRPKKTRVP